MGSKAVYNNQSVMIYITGEHARALLQNGSLILECYIGPHLIGPGGCYVELAPEVVIEFTKVLEAERDAIRTVKDLLKATNPKAATNPSQRRERRRKDAKRAHSSDVAG